MKMKIETSTHDVDFGIAVVPPRASYCGVRVLALAFVATASAAADDQFKLAAGPDHRCCTDDTPMLGPTSVCTSRGDETSCVKSTDVADVYASPLQPIRARVRARARAHMRNDWD